MKSRLLADRCFDVRQTTRVPDSRQRLQLVNDPTSRPIRVIKITQALTILRASAFAYTLSHPCPGCVLNREMVSPFHLIIFETTRVTTWQLRVTIFTPR